MTETTGRRCPIPHEFGQPCNFCDTPADPINDGESVLRETAHPPTARCQTEGFHLCAPAIWKAEPTQADPPETLAWPSEAQIEGLRQYVEWHGGAHTAECPADDTCACACKPLNDAVNSILSESFDRAVGAVSKEQAAGLTQEREELLAALKLMESVYRQNCVAEGEPSSILAAAQAAIAKAEAAYTAYQAHAQEQPVGDMRPFRFDCSTCGPSIAVDEDGCCRTCGADATPIQAHAQTTR